MRLYPPGPKPHRKRDILRTARSLWSLGSDPIGFVGTRFEEYGDLYHVDEGGGSHLYITRNPDHIREVLVTRASSFVKRGGANDRLRPILGDGLLTSDGELWRRQRRAIQPAFHGQRLAGYADVMVQAADSVDWAHGETRDISAEMMELTLQIVCRTLFHHDATDDTEVVADAMETLRQTTRQTLLPMRFHPVLRRRRDRALDGIYGLIDHMIEERRSNGLRADLLSHLLELTDGPGHMPLQLLRDELVTLFLAGHETTSHALTWTWYLLSQNPQARARLHEELDEVLAGRPPTLADLTALPWTSAVIDEAMRLFPPAFAVARVASVEVELGEYTLAPGAQVVCWIWHAHHDSRWFEEPEAFLPQRMLAPTFAKHAFVPFGAGQRMCVGASFARMELRLLLALLASRWDLRLSPDQRVGLSPRVTLAPKWGMRMVIGRRAGVTSDDK